MANNGIFNAVFHGNAEAVTKYLKADRSLVAARTSANMTPLHVAASRGHSNVARVLLKYGADLTGSSHGHDWTPLVWASYRGHYDVVKMLVEHGAGTTEADGNPIHYAGQRQHKEICKLLAHHGAVDDLPRPRNTNTKRLFRAAYSFDARTVDNLLSKKPSLISTKDKHGRTLLHEVCTNGDTKMIAVLLRHGIDAKAVDDRGQSALDRASTHGKKKVVKQLEQAGKRKN